MNNTIFFLAFVLFACASATTTEINFNFDGMIPAESCCEPDYHHLPEHRYERQIVFSMDFEASLDFLGRAPEPALADHMQIFESQPGLYNLTGGYDQYFSDAADFFADYLGLDLDAFEAAAANGELYFDRFFFDAYVPELDSENEMYPTKGAHVADVGFTVGLLQDRVIAPFGNIPADTRLFYSHYVIYRTATDPSPFLARVYANVPPLPNQLGTMPFVCSLYHAELGKGLATGIVHVEPTADPSQFNIAIRNVLSFGGITTDSIYNNP
eukprot:TRINITY_DN1071_c0_g1_i4.p1 TRINITY_DN1071_c0_g1~~TRINITY_DN1071_c0_g1_i4.p1  ORF type:complete len:279 (-),score=44.66 TRINITY_DN1071_c0_g1_i4:95-901(-)